jgi:hypothetical protein
MPRCPSCDYPLPGDRERLGARCPRCREPLYEPPTRISRPAREGDASCAVHAGQESVGTCARCGNYLCEVCRTPWQGKVVCAACVDRLLETGQATPEQARSHSRQAVLSACLGGGAWLATLAVYIPMLALSASDKGAALVLAMLCLAALCTGCCAAPLGLGQAVAALRVRGGQMVLATIGLVLNGLYLGAVIGMFTFGVWNL